MKNYNDLLKDFFIFKGLCDGDILPAIEKSNYKIRKYSSGDEIFSPHSHLRSVGYIAEGSTSVYNAGEGRKRTLLNIINAGGAFGVAGIFTDEYPTSVVANTKCTVLFIEEQSMIRLIEDYPTVAKNYILFLSDRIRFLNDKIDSFTKGSVEGRVAKLLLSRADGNTTSIGNMSRAATALGIGRASLYRILAHLEENGIIEQGKNEIKIKDKKYLEGVN